MAQEGAVVLTTADASRTGLEESADLPGWPCPFNWGHPIHTPWPASAASSPSP